MKKILKRIDLKNIVAFVVGGIMFGGITVVVAGQILASQVSYTKNGQSTVDGALDELYVRSSIWVDPMNMETPQYYAYGTYKGWCSSTDTSCSSYSNFPTTSTTPPSGKRIYAAKYEDGGYGICVKKDGTQYCFRGRNYTAEEKHIYWAFRLYMMGNCATSSSCSTSDFACNVSPDGSVNCTSSGGTYERCNVTSAGSVICYNNNGPLSS